MKKYKLSELQVELNISEEEIKSYQNLGVITSKSELVKLYNHEGDPTGETKPITYYIVDMVGKNKIKSLKNIEEKISLYINSNIKLSFNPKFSGSILKIIEMVENTRINKT